MAKYNGPIIDVDIHHKPKSDKQIVARLPKQWREYVAGNGQSSYPIKPQAGRKTALMANAARRADTFPADGSPSGSSYELLREQLLDRYGYYRGLVTWDLGEYASHLNPYFAAEVCRAANDWNIEEWLPQDERMISVAVIPSADPEAAVKEIRRVGSHPQIVGVLMSGNPAGRPWGHPHFHPIYEAVEEMGLTVSSHVSGGDRPNSMSAVGGPLANAIEHVSQLGQGGMNYVSSFVVHGVFEKFPTLRVLMVEYGLAWIPTLLWRLDREYPMLRSESPWVRRLPSEYILDHISFSTQPIEESPDDKNGLSDLLATIDGIENNLCFSTDYPHITMDDPHYVARLLPTAWQSKVFFENACRVYNLPAPQLSLGSSGNAGQLR
jgi:predicted TIM-barrel fold metal-dependent hydrolase